MTTLRAIAAAAALGLGLGLAQPLQACDLDGSFGSAGVATFSSPVGGATATGNDVLVLSNGRLLVAGAALDAGGNTQAAWWASDAQGNLVTSAAYSAMAGAGGTLQQFYTATQAGSGGPIYLAGMAMDAAGNTKAMLAKLQFPGLGLDASFGTLATGWVLQAAPGLNGAGVAVDSLGRVYLAAAGSLSRWTAAGVLDSSFAGGGSLTFDASGQARDLRLDSQGRLVVAGQHLQSPELWRVLPSGGMDPAFAAGGTLAVASGAPLSAFLAVDCDSSDGLLATGYADSAGGSQWLALRADSAGNTSAGFGTAGLAKGSVVSGLSGISSADGSLFNADGTLLLAGSAPSGLFDEAVLWQLSSAGVLDAAFGSGGQHSLASLPSAIQRPRLQGSLAFATGYDGTSAALWRLASCSEGPLAASPTPALPAGAGSSQAVAYPVPAKDHISFAFSLASASTVRLEIYDERGQRVLSSSRSLPPGPTVWPQTLAGFAPGVYLYRLIPDQGSAFALAKFVVQR